MTRHEQNATFSRIYNRLRRCICHGSYHAPSDDVLQSRLCWAWTLLSSVVAEMHRTAVDPEAIDDTTIAQALANRVQHIRRDWGAEEREGYRMDALNRAASLADLFKRVSNGKHESDQWHPVDHATDDPDPEPVGFSLSDLPPSMAEAATLLARGFKNRQIAAALGCSPATITRRLQAIEREVNRLRQVRREREARRLVAASN